MPSGTRTITFGTIGLDNIATEFKRNIVNVALGDYYKEYLPNQPMDTSVNINVPYGPAREGNPISIGNFYGAAWYKGQFYCGGLGESASQYRTNNDAYLYFQMIGCSSPSMRVLVAGSSFTIAGNGYDFTSEQIIVPIGNNDGSSTYTFQYTDCRGTWNRNITISYGRGGGSTTVDLLNTAPDNKLIRL